MSAYYVTERPSIGASATEWIGAVGNMVGSLFGPKPAPAPAYAPPPAPNYMPYILMGGGLLLVVVLMKSRSKSE